MKSLNTKKIVAMATGAALLGSALLGAVSYKNTELINDNGVPMAKIVVGSNAKVSDGVAAANIAAVLGNMAFKQVAVSATVDGVSGLKCDVSGEGAGTCSVLSKSVDLEVVTPAGVVPAGAYGFSTLINDYIDANLENRNATTNSDLEDSPFGDDKPVKKIGANDFTMLSDYTVKDTQSSVSAVEKQYIYVGNTDGVNVYYDDDKSELKAEDIKMAYEIEFEDYGIPVCSDSKEGSWAYYKYSDEVDTDKQLENHRVKVKFLGEEWIISELNPVDNGSAPTTNTEIPGGSIKLAKESAYSPKLQLGESLELGDGNKLVLGDLKPASGQQLSDIAIFSVQNAAGEEIASKTVSAGATTEITAGSATYRVRVYQVAPGYTLTEKWAEVAVFANELELIDGDDLSDNDEYPDNWEVSLVWKDKDANTGSSNGEDYVDHLHKIQLISGSSKDLLESDSLNIVENPAKFRLTFSGLDLTSDDYTSVDITLTTSQIDFFAVKPGDTTSDDVKFRTGVSGETTQLVRMKAASAIFEVYDNVDNTKYSTDELVYSLVGAYNASDATQMFLATNTTDLSAPVLLFKEGSKYYAVNYATHSDYDATNDAYATGDVVGFSIAYKVDKVRELNITGTISDNTAFASSGDPYEEINMTFEEDAENSQYNWIHVRLAEEKDKSDRYVFDANGDSLSDNYDEMNYIDVTETASRVELPYVTERGSKVDGRKSSMTIQLAEKVGRPTFLLQSTGAETTDANTVAYSNLKEGDEIDVLGAKVKVKAINVQTGACEATSGSATVSGIEGLTCVLNANAANLGERQEIPTDMVVLDKSATSTETVIAVGGPMVNTITEAILAGESPLTEAGAVFVDEVGAGKIVVAGYTADDTMTAAMNFIAQLKGQ